MRALFPLLPEPTVPRVLFSDRANYVFAMTEAPGRRGCGKKCCFRAKSTWRLPRMRAGFSDKFMKPPREPAIVQPFRDRAVFIQLRVDPFYRRVQERRPEVAGRVGEIADRMLSTQEALCHGDYSPKNILIHDRGFTLVDYETAHWGDPTMDLGFFLSHVILKAAHRPALRRQYFELTRAFWRGYLQVAQFLPAEELVPRSIEHFGVCTWRASTALARSIILARKRRRKPSEP